MVFHFFFSSLITELLSAALKHIYPISWPLPYRIVQKQHNIILSWHLMWEGFVLSSAWWLLSDHHIIFPNWLPSLPKLPSQCFSNEAGDTGKSGSQSRNIWYITFYFHLQLDVLAWHGRLVLCQLHLENVCETEVRDSSGHPHSFWKLSYNSVRHTIEAF